MLKGTSPQTLSEEYLFAKVQISLAIEKDADKFTITGTNLIV
jgi:hypothetical protein